MRNNRQIAKNTLLLYVRMLLIMGVSLLTVRLVIDALGIVDYGVYTVVAGVVTVFLFVSNSLSSGAQRFFAFEIGRNDHDALRLVFNLTLLVYVGLGLIVLGLGVTVGWWFFNEYLNIPSERMSAAKGVYVFSMLALLVNIVSTPYNALVVAHEKMGLFAGVSIIESVLKLLMIVLLPWFTGDKLLLYSLFVLIAGLLSRGLLVIYCHWRLAECRLGLLWDHKQFSTLVSYSGWNMFGAMVGVGKNQGANVLLNLFFGPVVNAARGIAFQVSGVFTQLLSNIYMATRPQITKLFAMGDVGGMWRLVFTSSKVTYFLLMVVAIPVFFEIEFLLNVWLKNYPPIAVPFVRLLITNILLEASANQLIAVLQAFNRIKNFQVFCNSVLLLNIPVSYVGLKMGYGEISPFVVAILLTFVYLFPFFLVVRKETGMPIRDYLRKVYLPMFLTTILAALGPFFFYWSMNDGLYRFLLVVLSVLFISIPLVYFVGLSGAERKGLVLLVKREK